MKITATERDTRRNQITATRSNLATIVDTFTATRSTAPAQTVAELVNRMGYDVAREAVAELVNLVGDWDHRIFPSVREWAQTVTTAATREELEGCHIFQPSEIHPAHINQIGEAMRDYTPAENSPEEAEEKAPSDPAAEVFPHLVEAVNAEAEAKEAAQRLYIGRGYFPSCAEDHRTDPDKGLKKWSTPKKWEAYQAGTLPRAKAVEIAGKRAAADVAKWREKQLAKLRTAATALALSFVSIEVEWKRNPYWGNNPTATISTNDGTYIGHASGCGYDKESAAVAEALNQSSAVLRVLYEAAEAALARGESYKRLSSGCVDWRDVLGYGSGYALLPYFDGGVGVSCFWSILGKCGFSCRLGASGRSFDSYTAERKGA